MSGLPSKIKNSLVWRAKALRQLDNVDTLFFNRAIGNIFFRLRLAGILKTPKAAFISTMGRSGTWYNREFIYFYNRLLSGDKPDEIKNQMVNEKIRISATQAVEFDNLGFDNFFIAHWFCPGFEYYQGPYKQQIEQLKFYSKHTYPGLIRPAKRKKFNLNYEWNPYKNPEARFVYYFRNPLDHFVSNFTGIQNHRDPRLRCREDSDRNLIPFSDISNFIETVGLDMYIKHYLPYKLMAKQFPNNFLLCTFEELVRNPHDTFSTVLKFLGHSVPLEDKQSCFETALKMSSKESIQDLENRYGTAISRSFNSTNERQLKDSKIGKWKNILTDNDVHVIETRFLEFGMSLRHFTLE